MTALPKPKMTVAEYLRWGEGAPAGRYELVQGTVVMQSPERARHNLLKLAAAIALRDAIKRAGVACQSFADGMTIQINDHTAREPDASVQCGRDVDLETIVLDAPLIVVEVVSPSSERDDTGTKLSEYFAVPSIQHYLIADPYRMLIIHHQRVADGSLRTTFHKDGAIALDPPGISIEVKDLLNVG